MNGLGTALRVELRKTTTTRMWWILLAVMVVYVAAIAAFIAFSFTVAPPADSGAPALEAMPNARETLYTLAMPLAYVFPVLVGTLAITTEYRYKTLTTTFLGQPRRATVLSAKLLVATLLGLLFGLAGILAGVTGVAPVLAVTGNDTGLTGDLMVTMLKVILGLGLWAAIGLGVGTLVRNQVAAIVVVVAFSQLVEPIARFGLAAFESTREVSKFLPGAAGDAMAGASLFTGGNADALLQWWQGALVLAGYAAVLLVIGMVTTSRRDVA